MATDTRNEANAVRINLYSDTQTLPTPEMRQAMAAAPVGDEQTFDDPSVNALCERVGGVAGQGGRGVPPVGHDVQRNRNSGPLSAGRRGHRRSVLPHPQLRGRRSRGPIGRPDRSSPRPTGHLFRRSGPGGDPRHAPLRPALRPARGGEHRQHGGRHRVAAGRRQGGHRGRPDTRPRHSPGRRSSAERRGRIGRVRRRVRGRLRQRLDRLEQGARLPGGCRSRRVLLVHR